MTRSIPIAILLQMLCITTPAASQAVMQRLAVEGLERSQLKDLAQPLIDSIGPRLSGTSGQAQANEWALSVYKRWGIPARAVKYGTWNNWQRGTTHVDLIAPRIRSLEAMLMTYSTGTNGAVEGPVILLPPVTDTAEFTAWLVKARGRFALLSYAEPTCRSDANLKEAMSSTAFDQMQKERNEARAAWSAGRRKLGLSGRALFERIESAGVLGVLVSLRDPRWPQGWGVSRLGTATAQTIPEIGLGCEDYGLIFRLAQKNQNPVIRVDAQAKSLGEAPVSNILAEMRGTEKPNEYVLLSAHIDSWDAASGATDNGTGTVMMMEAMRILKAAYPKPKRTIIAGHWSGEEQGLNGSAAFAADHPEIVAGIQAVFNADAGTGRIDSISTQGFTLAGDFVQRWLSQVPEELADSMGVIAPGKPDGGSDEASFTCHAAPAFRLSSRSWEYQTYTWHTNRDTFDKIVFSDLKKNATLIAMLAYLASEDQARIPRDLKPTAQCNPAARSTSKEQN